MADRLLTRAEVVEMVGGGITENTVACAARARRLAYVRVGNAYRFREQDVEAWIASMRVPAQLPQQVTFKLSPRSMARRSA